MHLIVIIASPTKASKSNTVTYTHEFLTGFSQQGATSEIFYLFDPAQWDDADSAFVHGEHILFALPLYNAMVPGIMMEFLEKLSAELMCDSSKDTPNDRKISFLLHSGFPESLQRKCCEEFLEKLPSKLNSLFSGILSHGNTLQIPFATSSNLKFTYEQLGKLFADNHCSFFFPEAKLFNEPACISKEDAQMYNRIFRFFCEHTAQARNCAFPLDYKPYETNNE